MGHGSVADRVARLALEAIASGFRARGHAAATAWCNGDPLGDFSPDGERSLINTVDVLIDGVGFGVAFTDDGELEIIHADTHEFVRIEHGDLDSITDAARDLLASLPEADR